LGNRLGETVGFRVFDIQSHGFSSSFLESCLPFSIIHPFPFPERGFLAEERNYFRRSAGHLKIRVAGGLAASPAEAREAGERMGPMAAGVRGQPGAAASSAFRRQEIALCNRE
jgi:hypothetical protein